MTVEVSKSGTQRSLCSWRRSPCSPT